MAIQNIPGRRNSQTKLLPQERKRRRKPWIERNLKYIAIILGILFMFQTMKGCLKESSYSRGEKMIIYERDSIYQLKDQQILDLGELLDQSQDENQRLIYELKIAGVKADEAEKRALAIQSTAEKIKSHTTTTITIEADTTRNKINQNNKSENE